MRASDEKKEQIANKFLLDNFFKKYDSHAELIFDKDRQVCGTDLVFKGAAVDIKVQTSYLNNPTDTYIVEISTLNRSGDPVQGWFIHPMNTTEFYCFAWIHDADVDEKGNLLKVNKAEIMFLRKSTLRKCIRLRVSDDELLKVAELMRKNNIHHRRLDNDIHYVMSEQLKEKPVALVVSKSLLHALSIKHCMVSEDSIQNMEVNVTK